MRLLLLLLLMLLLLQLPLLLRQCCPICSSDAMIDVGRSNNSLEFYRKISNIKHSRKLSNTQERYFTHTCKIFCCTRFLSRLLRKAFLQPCKTFCCNYPALQKATTYQRDPILLFNATLYKKNACYKHSHFSQENFSGPRRHSVKSTGETPA